LVNQKTPARKYSQLQITEAQYPETICEREKRTKLTRPYIKRKTKKHKMKEIYQTTRQKKLLLREWNVNRRQHG
jgi:hypothetical protein